MKIHLNNIFKTLDGKLIPEQKEYTILKDDELLKDEKGNLIVKQLETKNPLTLKDVIIQALLDAPYTENTEEIKTLRYTIAKKVKESNEEIELTLDELVLIKKLIGIMFTPIIVGQVNEFLK